MNNSYFVLAGLALIAASLGFGLKEIADAIKSSRRFTSNALLMGLKDVAEAIRSRRGE